MAGNEIKPDFAIFLQANAGGASAHFFDAPREVGIVNCGDPPSQIVAAHALLGQT
jgi:hypothetical protein